jgi:hypothetical protein
VFSAADGTFSFYVAVGTYDIEISSGSGSKTLDNVVIDGTTSAFSYTVLDDTTSNAWITTLTSTRSETGATAVPLLTKFRERISVFDFMSAAQIADVLARTSLVDVTSAIQAALNAGSTNVMPVHFPAGTYLVSDTLWPVPEGSSAKSAVMIGDGGGYVSTSAQTIINGSSITNKPIINLQKVRGAAIKGMRIVGPVSSMAAAVGAMAGPPGGMGGAAVPGATVAGASVIGEQQAPPSTGFRVRTQPVWTLGPVGHPTNPLLQSRLRLLLSAGPK